MRKSPRKFDEENMRSTVFGRLQPIFPFNGEWACLCSCGNATLVTAGHLVDGHVKSCGCLLGEVSRKRMTTHGRSKDRIYRVWAAMHTRCTNPKSHDYGSYGGRGIKVCVRWNQFSRFLSDMGERPVGTSLDRINPDKGYYPKNCKWSTKDEQASNQRTNVRLTYNGETLILAEWARRLGFSRSTTLRRRLNDGWSLSRTLSTPKGEK